MENVTLEILPKDGGRLMEELHQGNMVIARSKNEFLYILDGDDCIRLFSHVPGAPGGGRKQIPKDDKNSAVVRKLAELSDHLYKAEFDKAFDIYGVMCCAEEGILSMFPGDDRDGDSDIEFTFPGSESK